MVALVISLPRLTSLPCAGREGADTLLPRLYHSAVSCQFWLFPKAHVGVVRHMVPSALCTDLVSPIGVCFWLCCLHACTCEKSPYPVPQTNANKVRTPHSQLRSGFSMEARIPFFQHRYSILTPHLYRSLAIFTLSAWVPVKVGKPNKLLASRSGGGS